MTDELTEIDGVGPAIAESLREAGFETVNDVMTASAEELADVHGIGEKSAKDILTRKPGAGGRDPKLTKEREESIAQMLESGHSIKAACRCNGIHHSTFYDWLEKGEEQAEGIYADFSDRVVRARGAGEASLVDEMLDMAREKNDAKTILSVLKSRYPDSWGDIEEGDEGSTVEVLLTADRDQS